MDIKKFLNEINQKRNKAISIAINKKLEIYKKIPKLEKIENDINILNIQLIQNKLTTKDKKNIEKIKQFIEKLQEEKKEILLKNKIDENEFNPKFECSRCCDTGFVKEKDNLVFCKCIKQKIYNEEYNTTNIYDLKNHTFDKFDINKYSEEVNLEQYGEKISPKKNMELIKKKTENFIKNFNDINEKNLLFSGNTGLGKTFLSSCIANEMIKNGKTVLYQTAPLMLDNIIDTKFKKIDNNLINSIYNVDLLIIDDLGAENSNSIKKAELFNIINSRLLNQNNKITKTIISTNLSLQELYNEYDERIVSRIIGNYTICKFFGDDIRLNNILN